jgi:hypothetical protein
LRTDQCIEGPALVTETTSTTWIDQGWRARLDRWGNILLDAINEEPKGQEPKGSESSEISG